MPHDRAPYHADIAPDRPEARAYWVRASDGLRLRIAHFAAAQPRGAVLLFPGRTEYVEKYSETAAALCARGYDVLVIDWRGQGLADRMLEDPRTGHVQVFEDYQKDVAAMTGLARDLDLPRPWHLLAHSMGGCIGLRAVMDGLDVASCVFTGPMWGIRIAAPVRPAAWALSWSSKQVGLGHMLAPGTRIESMLVTDAFDDNTLTRDRAQWDQMRAQILARPELQLGGPSLQWLHEALAECRDLARRPAPQVPCLCYLGENERIVDTQRIHDRMASWPGGRLDLIDGAEHEILMELPEVRSRVLAEAAALFERSVPRTQSRNAC
jgi:lysophospholipase